jgi:hypothetical protein
VRKLPHLGECFLTDLWNLASDDFHFVRPHLGETRQVQTGQKIHESVFQQMKKRKREEEHEYSPLARLPKRFRWDDVESIEKEMVEKDPYTDVAGVIDGLHASSTVSIGQLEGLTTVIATGELPLIHMPSHRPSFRRSESGRRAISETKNAAAVLLDVLHDAYTRRASESSARERRSIELLLRALAACRPTEEDEEEFAAELMESVIETGRQEAAMRNVVIEVLKLFGPGERQFCAHAIMGD